MYIDLTSGVSGLDTYKNLTTKTVNNEDNNSSFEVLFQSALDLVNETNELSNRAEEEEMSYAMGTSDNLHTLQIAQQKANISLQYTVAVRNAVLDAYKEIMNMQF